QAGEQFPPGRPVPPVHGARSVERYQGPAVGRKGQSPGFLPVPPEALAEAPRPRVPQPDDPSPATGREGAAVGGKGERLRAEWVPPEHGLPLPGARVPQTDRAVPAGHGQGPAVGGKGEVETVLAVSPVNPAQDPRGILPDSQGTVLVNRG